MEEALTQELANILSDLERIGDLVAQKESELGIVRSVSLTRQDADCFALAIDDRVFYLTKAQFDSLAAEFAIVASLE